MRRLKAIVKSALPLLPVPADRALTRLLRTLGLTSAAYAAYVRCGRPEVVVTGPFAGMKTIDRAAGSAHTPKVSGTYEKELHEELTALCATPFELLINIGSAEGYYAVGFLLEQRGLRALCIDIDPEAGPLLSRLAARNGVLDRVEVAITLPFDELEARLEAGLPALVICDCEGAEDALLCPEVWPSLARATILVELHECYVPGISQRVRARFEGSHSIAEIRARPRQPEELVAWPELSSAERLAMMDEGRDPNQNWFVMRPV